MQLSSLDASSYSQILLSLDELAQRQRTARKLLVCSYGAEGRELLRALALAGHGWIGFEPTDPRKLANELVAHDIVRDGLRIADGFDLLALLDQAVDEVIGKNGAGGISAEVKELAEHVGFRDAIRRSIETLRLEAIDSPSLRCAGFEDLRKRNLLADIYSLYEQKLRHAKLADAADVFGRAAHGLSRGTLHLPKATIVLMPGLSLHGLAGKFLNMLRDRGAIIPQTDSIVGLQRPRFVLAPSVDAEASTKLSRLYALDYAPTRAMSEAIAVSAGIDLFAASNPLHEIKEVLRRAIAHGYRWDEVEIIATDANLYGCALDSLARRLAIPVSYAIGLPVERTRPGRVVSAYLRWIQEDFREADMRTLLESGDIAPGGEHRNVDGVSLARRLRKLRVGWGRERYLAHIEAALAAETLSETDEAQAEAPSVTAELQALRSLLEPVLDATPAIPDRLRPHARRISPAAIGNGLLSLLQFTVIDHDVDRIAAERITARLERVRATMTREMLFSSALAALRDRLNVRVPAVGATGPAPWTASPGHIHLSNIEHGGFTGRRAVFVVGLDAGRFPGTGGLDPLLTDEDRRRIASTLTTSSERVAEAQYRFAALFARLRGSVTLSYAAYDAVEGRKLSPSATMLQAYRLAIGNTGANYEDLRTALGALATAVPQRDASIDQDDVWLAAMADGGLMRSSQETVRAAFAGLDRGLRARAERAGKEPSRFHGLIGTRDSLDPRISRDVLSASRLETLGACGLRYFYQYVLGIRPPDIAAFDPTLWLDARNRGSLLHDVYEHTLRAARAQSVEVLTSEFEHLALRVLEAECVKWRERVPPPSDTVYEREVGELRQDVAAFADMCRNDGARWLELELQFGWGGREPVRIELASGSILLGGRIDRIDRLEDDRLLVIDYKTGGTSQYNALAFHGGRRLQHFLYSVAAEQLLGKPVARMEYRFPTKGAESDSAPYELAALAGGRELIDLLLDNVAAGRFLPTDNPDDCTFCDFGECCRISAAKGKQTISPLAAWARTQGPACAEYAPLVQIRQRFK
jgi:ATP-dependent helicase/nuclease subunit B